MGDIPPGATGRFKWIIPMLVGQLGTVLAIGIYVVTDNFYLAFLVAFGLGRVREYFRRRS